MKRILFLAVAVLAAIIAACSTPPVEGPQTAVTPPESRYARPRDGAPLQPISPEEVGDAVPRADPILSVGNRSPYTVDAVTYEVLSNYRGYRQVGIASWYGAKFDGYETSNGEIFDVYQASAAHRTLPIPCYARVTNLENGRSVVVRINDRGPFHSERLIDLSYAAAVKLGYMERGTAQVEVAVLDVPGVDDRRNSGQGDYRYLQLGAFGSQDTARALQGRLRRVVDEPVEISMVQSGPGVLYRVRIGPLAGNDALRDLQRQLEDGGYGSGLPLP